MARLGRGEDWTEIEDAFRRFSRDTGNMEKDEQRQSYFFFKKKM
jgi:hypothetical protein